MTIFHDGALQDMFPEGGRRAELPNVGLGQSLWKWAQNKVRAGSSIPSGDHCFLLWDSFSQGSRTIETNALKGQGNRQCWESQRTQWPALRFRPPQGDLTAAKAAWSDLIGTILKRSWAISVVMTEFLLYCSLCRKSTTDLAKQMIFLKRIIYGGLAIFRVIL